MTPEQIARNGSEHAEQAALFAWAAMAANYGFDAANEPGLWQDIKQWKGEPKPVPELALMFAIPNGGQRGDGTALGAQISGGKLKAEGVKEGVSDIFLPVSRRITTSKGYPVANYESAAAICGLFIEMKRANGKPSDVTKAQREFGKAVTAQGYAFHVCYGWLQARDVITNYLKS